MNPLVGRDIPAQARTFVLLGVVVGAAFSGFLVLFVAGEMLSDPGGVQGLLLVTAWLALPVLLSVLALGWPRVAYPILVAVVAAVILTALMTIPLAHQVWEFEDSHGPINLMVLIGALMPLVVLGRTMPARAGWLMAALIGGSLLAQAVSLALVGQWSVILVFAVLMPPFVAVAILFVLAGKLSRRDPPQRITTVTGNSDAHNSR